MRNQPLPYPPKPRSPVYTAHSTVRSFGWAAFGVLAIFAACFLIYFYHVSWLAECAVSTPQTG